MVQAAQKRKMTTMLERHEYGLREVKLTDEGSGRFSGYGAVFGNVDSYGDVIERGAFKDTLLSWQDRGKWPPMLLQHGGGVFGGGADDLLPIGKWTSMHENAKGLKVEGELFAVNTERGQYIYEGLKSGVLDGLSIGFVATDVVYGSDDNEPERTLTGIELWEVSIVTFPANPQARVSAVKTISVDQLRELEGVLGDRGLSRTDRVKAVSAFKQWLQRDDGGQSYALESEAQIIDAIERLYR